MRFLLGSLLALSLMGGATLADKPSTDCKCDEQCVKNCKKDCKCTCGCAKTGECPHGKCHKEVKK